MIETWALLMIGQEGVWVGNQYFAAWLLLRRFWFQMMSHTPTLQDGSKDILCQHIGHHLYNTGLDLSVQYF